MRKRNQRLFVIVCLMIVANLVFFTSSTGTFSRTEKSVIAVADTSVVASVKLTRAGAENWLQRNREGWTLNKEFETDPGYVRILLAVMNRVAVKRQLGVTQIEELRSRLEADAVFVELEDLDRSFYVLGNRTYTKTFFLESDLETGYEVEIPGYRDFVGGIFQLTTDQWRDRLIFRGNFRTIDQIEVRRNDERILKAGLKDGFFAIEGLTSYDTLALVNYLNGFNYLQANERISSGKFPQYDSLRETNEKDQLIIGDLGLPTPLVLDIYPALPGENFQLTVVNGKDMTVIASNRIQNWLKRGQDFSSIRAE